MFSGNRKCGKINEVKSGSRDDNQKEKAKGLSYKNPDEERQFQDIRELIPGLYLELATKYEICISKPLVYFDWFTVK